MSEGSILPVPRAVGRNADARVRARGLRALARPLRGLVSAGLLGVLAWRTDWSRLGQAFAGLKPALWLGAVGLYLAIQVVSSLRWQLLARPLGFDPGWRRFTGFYFIGMFFNLVLPTSVGGDVVRAWYLDGHSGRRLDAFLTVLVDRVSGLLVLLALACAGAALCPFALPGWVSASVWGAAGAAVGGVAAAPLLIRCGDRWGKLRRLAEGGRTYLRRPGLLAGTALLSVIVQAGNVGLVWAIGRAFGAPVPGAYYWVLVPMVSLLTMLPLSVNGMGIREGSTALFLAPLGVAEGTAICLAVLWFAAVTLASLAGGLVYLFGRFPRPEVRADHEPVGGHSHQGRAGQPRAAA